MIRIEHWSIVTPDTDPFLAPELRKPCLAGRVFGDPRRPDGTRVTTSPIVAVIGEHVLTSSGSEYELGDIDSTYAALYPGARARLIAVKQQTPLSI